MTLKFRKVQVVPYGCQEGHLGWGGMRMESRAQAEYGET